MWYFNKDNGNFSVGEIPTIEIDGELVEQEGWELIPTRPEPHDDYVFDGEKWNKKEVVKIVPQSITPRQIRQQLTAMGIRQAAEDYIANSNDYNLKDWWQYSTSFDRDNEVLINAALALGLTESQLDEIFITADKL